MSRKMKDSGIEWIGEIPQDWEVTKLKRKIKCLDGRRRPVSSDLRVDGEYPYWGAGSITDYVDDYLFDEEIVLLGEDGAPFFDKIRDVAFYINEKVWVNNHIHVLKPNNDCCAKYLTHFLNIADYRSYINGSILNKLTQSNMNDINIVIPKITEQQKIANFLDQKVSEIDHILEKTRKSIQEYKKYKQSLITEAVTKGLNPDVEMKDSGIEWIGEIPKHWEVIKIKYISNKIGSGKTPLGGADIYTDEGIMFLRSQNIYNEGLSLRDVVYISKKIDEGMKNTRVYKGDILLNITGGSIGRATIYPFDEHANVNQHVCIIRGGSDLVFNNFLHYTLISNVGYNAINVYQSGANREGLNFEQIGNFEIPLINIEEQIEIIKYLNTKCTEIDSLISQKEALLSDLETYKKSLIYECVTGKREVD